MSHASPASLNSQEPPAPTSASAVNRWEMACVGLAFLTMATGGLAEAFDAPEAVSTVLYAVSYLTGGYFGTVSAWESLREKEIDIDLLMILAALGAAFVGAPFEGAMLLFLFSFSNVLQDYAMGRSRKAIEALAKLRPRVAHVQQHDGSTTEVPVEQVQVGQRFVLRPGEQVPLDGCVLSGESAVDQSSVTGESIPVTKRPGDQLFAGTINAQGGLTVEVTRAASDSTIARLITLVEEAQARKAASQRFLEAFEKKYAVGVIALTLVLIAVLPLFGLGWSDAFYRAITVMVVASPCALVISTPASILSAIANAARKGVLFKGGAQLEKAARIRTVLFDKTGTLTVGQPQVSRVVPLAGQTADEALQLAASAEIHSEHPLGQAIVAAAQQRGLQVQNGGELTASTGRGIETHFGEHRVLAGRAKWVAEALGLSLEHVGPQLEALAAEGQTVIALGEARPTQPARWAALICLADQLRSETLEALQSLRANGIAHTCMLTGDNAQVAQAIARQVSLDCVHAELLPEDKVRLVQEHNAREPVAMVGDGTNDAPALASASLGIAMGAAGSDVALETADVVLMSSDLRQVSYALRISRAANRIVWQNLTFAGGVIVIMVIATLLLPVWGIEVPLPLGVLAHEGGTVLVCLNGLRLLGFR
ncbi:MAG: heavy metal translocating P-type ATPase [Verrucomicrobiota bacterium JB022]|nr:heavy metal translocating P-type ATPase [Verrucomicrobiota bacterium JB022]